MSKLPLALLVSLALGIGTRAEACSCAPPLSVSEAVSKASAVFAGRVREIRKSGNQVRVGLRVYSAWKGLQAPYVELFTAASSAACGIHFRPWNSYLIYAYADPRTGQLLASLCSRTKALSVAETEGETEQLGVPRYEPAYRLGERAGAVRD